MRIDGDAGGEGKGRVDILICNAGIMFSPQTELTVDGYEKTWGVNCLGHFVFTTALLGTLALPISLAIPGSHENCPLTSRPNRYN